MENPKDSIRKLMEIINSVGLQDTKSIHKNLLHFYILIKKSEKEIYPIYKCITKNKISKT